MATLVSEAKPCDAIGCFLLTVYAIICFEGSKWRKLPMDLYYV